MPIGMLILWIAINLLLGFGLHYYIWRRLVTDPRWRHPWSKVLTGLLAVFAVSLPVVALGLRFFGPQVHPGLVWPVYIWMATGLYLVLSLLGIDALRAARRLLARHQKADLDDPARRMMFSRLFASGAALAAGGMSTAAVASAAGGPLVRQVSVRLRRLHRAMHGTRVVQITDLHVGQLIGRDYVREVVRRANALAPDLVVITGDLVDGTPEHLDDAVAELGHLQAKHGVYFVTGNHEYYSGVDAWLEFLPKLGIRVLQNQRVLIGDPSTGFDLAGVNDVAADRFDGHRCDLNAALAGRESERPVVLLAHHPKCVFGAAKAGVDLQISGHTHGGQIWPFTWVAHVIFPYVHGLANHEGTQIYVSRGTGWVGPPARLGAPSELTLIELQAEEAIG